MNEKDRSYVKTVLETARSLWGEETVSKMITHLTQTAQAVQIVSNHTLTPEVEPVIKMRLEEK